MAPKARIKPPQAGRKPPRPGRQGDAQAQVKPKVKSTPRQPAVVHPIGVLPPESISRAAHKPARPLVLPARPRGRPRSRASRWRTVPGSRSPANDYPEFEQRLLEERVRVLKEMGHYENTVLKVNQRDSAGDLSGYSFHMADVGTDAMEREKAFQLASAEGRILLEINEALRRMARGEYGRCESCENPILSARLEAMPIARLCLSCKEKEERAAPGHVVIRQARFLCPADGVARGEASLRCCSSLGRGAGARPVDQALGHGHARRRAAGAR